MTLTWWEEELTDRLSNSAREYGMEISREKSIVMVNSGDNTTVQISMNGQQLEEVMAFKYIGATLTKDGRSTAEIKIRLAIATASMAKPNNTWSSKDVSFFTKIKLYKNSCPVHPILRLWELDVNSWLNKKDTGIQDKCYKRMGSHGRTVRQTNLYKEL